MAQIVLLPVRHHSPACAFHVARITEGPSRSMVPRSEEHTSELQSP